MVLLKPYHWYPVSALEKWKREVGPEGILPSMEPLCRPVTEFLSPESTPVKQEEVEPKVQSNVIDLTMDSDDEDVKPNLASLNNAGPVAGPSKHSEPPGDMDPFCRVLQANPGDVNLDFFCEDESVMTIEELLNRMTVDQLKGLAKQNKCIPSVRKPKVVALVYLR
jgi:Fanconi-associated nuclease 1